MNETALSMTVDGDELIGILHAASRKLGVVVVVGGPQYRVGSHRQFVLLARALAAGGFPVLRFDYRGLGDSAGEARDFEAIADDLRVAVDTLIVQSGAEQVVIWGLCDAASAALMYGLHDGRVAGLVLLNPWVHTVEAEAKVRLKTYYAGRLRSAEFWRKLFSFDLDWRDSVSSLSGYLRRALVAASPAVTHQVHFIDRMRQGWLVFNGPSLVILSGDDFTAGEFRQLCAADPTWRSLLSRPSVLTVTLPDANHTFARMEWRERVEQETLAWLQRLEAAHTLREKTGA